MIFIDRGNAMRDRQQSPQRTEVETGGVQQPHTGAVAHAPAFVDKRASAVVQGKLVDMMNGSPRLSRQPALSDAIHDSPRMVESGRRTRSLAEGKPNDTGLPDRLKSGIESLSGMSMDHVKVHYNSPEPARLQAHAYAQGSEIHVAPGQERHLPHEAWHVVQQAQGRVRPTMQMKAGVNLNDDVGLEREADVMGDKALQISSSPTRWPVGLPYLRAAASFGAEVQLVKTGKRSLTDYLASHQGNGMADEDDEDHEPDPGLKRVKIASDDSSDEDADVEDNDSDSASSVDYGEFMRRSRDSKKKFHRRTATAFATFSNIKDRDGKLKKKLAGPHILSHVATDVGFGAIEPSGRGYQPLFGTHVIPTPKQANSLLKSQAPSDPTMASAYRKQRHQHIHSYTDAYRAAEGDPFNLAYAAAARELSPNATYNLHTGSYTADEIKGKGERRTNAYTDFQAIHDADWKPDDPLPDGLKNIDAPSTGGSDTMRRSAEISAGQFVQYCFGIRPRRASFSGSELSSTDSESDSD